MYYTNSTTGETTGVQPWEGEASATVPAENEGAASGEGQASGEWLEAWDEASGAMYYANSTTGETTSPSGNTCKLISPLIDPLVVN